MKPPGDPIPPHVMVTGLHDLTKFTVLTKISNILIHHLKFYYWLCNVRETLPVGVKSQSCDRFHAIEKNIFSINQLQKLIDNLIM